MERTEEWVADLDEVDPAGDLDAELAQLADVETLVANIFAASCPTNSTAACSGGVCCV